MLTTAPPITENPESSRVVATLTGRITPVVRLDPGPGMENELELVITGGVVSPEPARKNRPDGRRREDRAQLTARGRLFAKGWDWLQNDQSYFQPLGYHHTPFRCVVLLTHIRTGLGERRNTRCSGRRHPGGNPVPAVVQEGKALGDGATAAADHGDPAVEEAACALAEARGNGQQTGSASTTA